jgi:FAD:protein FMN transferase
MSLVLPAITALGTTWLVELFDEVSLEKADETHGLIRLFLSDFEATYSRFKPDSTISRLNATGELTTPDEATIQLLTLGQQLYRDTSGIFNMLVGEHLVARGYDADYSFMPKVEPSSIPSPLEAISITPKRITLNAGQIDLGGYGKGYLIDRLTELLKEHGFKHFLINGGGDMYATSDHGTPITIYLEHPSVPGTYIAKTTLKDQGFAASSTHKRRWKVSGQEYSHIVDTSTKKAPSADDFGIYVKAPHAVTADAWSTTLLISPPEHHTEALARARIAFARFNTTDNTLRLSRNFSIV